MFLTHHVSRAALILGAASSLVAPVPAPAQTPPNAVQQDVDRMKLENDRRDQQLRTLQLRNDIQAERVEQITALGLPKFDGTAKLENGGGAMEISVLASAALMQATGEIVGVERNDLILAAGEMPPRGDIAALREAQTRLTAALRDISTQCPSSAQPGKPGKVGVAAVGVVSAIGTVVSAATALAGMFRSERTYTGIAAENVSAALFADMLAAAKSARRGDTPLPVASVDGGLASQIRAAQTSLENARRDVARKRADLETKAADKRSPAESACLAAATAGLQAAERYDAIWTAPGDDGDSRYQKVLRFMALLEGTTGIVQVNVKAGGTAIQSKDIGTFFGADPLRLTGQLWVSWTRYALSGDTIATKSPTGGIVVCGSRRMSMTDVYRFVRAQPSRTPDVACRRITPSTTAG